MNDRLESDILKELRNQLSSAQEDLMESESGFAKSKFDSQPNKSIIAKLMIISHGEPARLYGTDKLLKLPTPADREGRHTQIRKLLRGAFTKSLKRQHKKATDKEIVAANREMRTPNFAGVGQTRAKFYAALQDDPVPKDLVTKWNNELRNVLNNYSITIKSQLQMFMAYLNEHDVMCTPHHNTDSSDYMKAVKSFDVCKSRNCTDFPVSLSDETPIIDKLLKLVKTLDGHYGLDGSITLEQIVDKIRGHRSCYSPDKLAAIYMTANAIVETYTKITHASKDVMAKPFDDLDYKLLTNSAAGRKFAKKSNFWVDDIQFVQGLDSPKFTMVAYIYFVFHELAKKDKELTIEQCLEMLSNDFGEDETHGKYWRELAKNHPELLGWEDTYSDLITNKADLDEVVKNYLKSQVTLDNEELANITDIWGIRPVSDDIPSGTAQKTFETDVPRQDGDNRPSVLDLVNAPTHSKFAWVILTGTDYTAMVPGSKIGNENKAHCPICGGAKVLSPDTVADFSLIKSVTDDNGKKSFLGQSDITQSVYNIYKDRKGDELDLWPKCTHCYGTGFDEPWYWSACRKPEDKPPFIKLYEMLWDYLKSKKLEPEAYDGVLRNKPVNGKATVKLDDGRPIPLPRRPHTYGTYGNEIEKEQAVESSTVIIKVKKLGDDPLKSQKAFIDMMDEFRAMLGANEFSAEIDRNGWNVPGLGLKAQYNIVTWKIEPIVGSDVYDTGSTTVSGNKSTLRRFLAERNSKTGRAPSTAFLADLHQLIDLAYQFESFNRPTYAYPIWVFIDRAKRNKVPPEAIRKWTSTKYSSMMKYLYEEIGREAGDDYFIKRKGYFKAKIQRLMDRAESFDYDGVVDISDRLVEYARSADVLALVRNAGIYGAKKSDVKSGSSAQRIQAIIQAILNLKDPPSTILMDGIPQSFHPACDMLVAAGRLDVAETVYDISDDKLLEKMSEDKKISEPLLRQIKLINSKLMADEKLLDVLDRFDEEDLNKVAKHYRKALPQYGIIKHSMDSLNSLKDADNLKVNQVKLMRSAYRQLKQKCAESETYRNALDKLKGGHTKALSDLDAFITTAERRVLNDHQAKKLREFQRHVDPEETPSHTTKDAEFTDEYVSYGIKILTHGEDDKLSRRNSEYWIVNRLIRTIHTLSIRQNMVQLGAWWNPNKLATSIKNLIPLVEWCLSQGFNLKVPLDGLFYPGINAGVDDESLSKVKAAVEHWNDHPQSLYMLIRQYMKTVKK